MWLSKKRKFKSIFNTFDQARNDDVMFADGADLLPLHPLVHAFIVEDVSIVARQLDNMIVRHIVDHADTTHAIRLQGYHILDFVLQ